MTWHQWHHTAPTSRRIGLSSFAFANASFPPGVPAHGLVGRASQVRRRLLGETIHRLRRIHLYAVHGERLRSFPDPQGVDLDVETLPDLAPVDALGSGEGRLPPRTAGDRHETCRAVTAAQPRWLRRSSGLFLPADRPPLSQDKIKARQAEQR